MINLLRDRRSVRVYKDQSIKDDKINILKEAVLRSPSSRSLNPWEFIFIQSHEMLEKLARAKAHGSAFLKDAPLGIMVLGDETASDVWIEDCSIASILVQLTAQSLDLGSCWIQIRRRNHDENTTADSYVKELLGVPEHLRVESIIAVGYPEHKPEGIPQKNLDYSKVKDERY